MLKVLYVDDERGMLEIGKECLEMSGKLSVETAISAYDGLSKMGACHYDAIVSDYQMPALDGLGFLRYVRDADRHIPFILFTGRGREDVVIEACNAGASCYLQKGGDATSMFLELELKIIQAVDKTMAEKALLIKNVQANLAMDLAKIASWEYDPETRMFKFDELFYKLYGIYFRPDPVDILSPRAGRLGPGNPSVKPMPLLTISRSGLGNEINSSTYGPAM